MLYALLLCPQHYHSYPESTDYTGKSNLGLIQMSGTFPLVSMGLQIDVVIKHISLSADSASAPPFSQDTPSFFAFISLFVK